MMAAMRTALYFFILPVLLVVSQKLFFSDTSTIQHGTPEVPDTYPILGSFLSFNAHKDDRLDWLTSLLRSSPTSTVTARHPLGAGGHVITANPANVEYILKTNFSNYPKGPLGAIFLGDLFGRGIANVDGEEWMSQRRIAVHEFSSKSLREFIQTVIDREMNSRLLPILESSSEEEKVLDLQDILRRFAFDNICNIAFGYDPELLLPSLPESPFATAFGAALSLTEGRFLTFFPLVFQVKRFLNVGSERELKQHISLVRDFAGSIARKKIIHSNDTESESSSADLLSRFIVAGYNDEQLLTDIVISFILAGRDTTSATLTWFFWLVSRHPGVEQKILDEIRSIDTDEMIYTQGALYESMRLYPPIPDTIRQAVDDDTWPDGTVVAAGTTVAYYMYSMGRMERIWGDDWSQFKPERWLELEDNTNIDQNKMRFVPKDPYSYPVLNAGPRDCLGKEMAIFQMKKIVAAVLKRYTIVPAVEGGFQPVYVPLLTADMEGGLPVKFLKRDS